MFAYHIWLYCCLCRSLSGSQLAEQGAQSRVNSPPKQPPSTQLKTHKSSWVNGPAAEGHAANGPASNGPAPDAPASSRAPAAEGAAFNGPASTGPTSNGPATDAPAPARGPTVLRSFENQGPPTFPHMGPFNTLTFPSLGSNYGQAFSNHNPPHGQSSQTLPSTHPVKHQLSQAGFNSHMGQTHFSQQSSQHAGQGFNPAVQGGGTPDSLGGYSQAQLQAMLASCMRRDEHREEAVLGAASHDFASISQWLQQAHDVAGKQEPLFHASLSCLSECWCINWSGSHNTAGPTLCSDLFLLFCFACHSCSTDCMCLNRVFPGCSALFA